MTPNAACGTCGRPLTAGFCPRCLLGAGLSPGTDELPTQAEPAAPHPQLGDYELLEEIGRGGMGIVYRARQVSLDRMVAVKLLPFGALAGKQSALRLRAEAVAAGSLRHPNIVAIHEVGRQNEQHFIAMELVPGPSLAHVLRDGPLPDRQAAQLVRQVALAVQHAHERGIIHRDLKPSNILLDTVDGQPRITDFGLAKNLRSDTQLTLTGQTLGSPNYIPPEQIRGNEREEALTLESERGNPTRPEAEVPSASPGPKVSFASDVYALGATLYHSLAGRPPFIGHDIAAILHQVLQDEPLPPRRLNPSVPADLETICLKCLEKESGQRYGTAQELADELGRFLNHEPILARPVGTPGKAWRWCRRNPVIASLASATLLLLLTVAIGAPIAAFRINGQRRQAELRAYTSDMNVVQQAWGDGNLRRAQDLLRAHIPRSGEPDLRGFEWRYLWKLCQDESRLSFTNFPSEVRMVLSPDGRFAAAASGQLVKLLDYANGRELDTLATTNTTDDISALAFSPSDNNVLATTSGNEVSLWNLAERRVTATIPLSNAAVALAISRDGKLLAAASGHQQTITLWRLTDDSRMWERSTPTQVFALLFAPDGNSLISGGGELANPLLWDLASGTSVSFAPEREGWINTMVLSPDGHVLATGSTDSAVILWDLAQRKLLGRLVTPGADSAASTAFSPDGRRLVTGYTDSAVRLWDLGAPQQPKALYRGHKYGVTSVAFSPDGRSLLSSSGDGTVKVWDPEPRSHEEILTRNNNGTLTSDFSPDGKRLASIDFGGGLTLWDIPARRRISQRMFAPKPSVAAFSPNGEILAQALEQGIKLWDAKTCVLQGELTNGFDAISLSFSSDSRILAAAGLTGFILEGITNRLAFWDLSTKRKINKLAAAAPCAVIVSFSHNGRMVAIGYLDGEVRLWDYESEQLLAKFTDQHQRIWAVAFSPNDARLVAGGDEGATFFYDVRTRRALPRMTVTSTWVTGLCFTPDGKTLASAEGDGRINLWNVATREIALTLRGHVGWLGVGTCFSPDGNLLASAGSDGTVRLWPAASFEEIPKQERPRK